MGPFLGVRNGHLARNGLFYLITEAKAKEQPERKRTQNPLSYVLGGLFI